MEVPRGGASEATIVVEIPANGDCGIVSWRERGYAFRIRANTEGNDMGEGQGLRVVGRGAAHSNTQGEGNGSIDSLVGYKGGRGDRRDKDRDRRRNLGLHSCPKVS